MLLECGTSKLTYSCFCVYIDYVRQIQIVSEIRKTMESLGFIEVETPVLQVLPIRIILHGSKSFVPDILQSHRYHLSKIVITTPLSIL